MVTPHHDTPGEGYLSQKTRKDRDSTPGTLINCALLSTLCVKLLNLFTSLQQYWLRKNVGGGVEWRMRFSCDLTPECVLPTLSGAELDTGPVTEFNVPQLSQYFCVFPLVGRTNVWLGSGLLSPIRAIKFSVHCSHHSSLRVGDISEPQPGPALSTTFTRAQIGLLLKSSES